MSMTAVITVVLSLCVAADPPSDRRSPVLEFELVDGTVITGRIDAKMIGIRIASGNVLNIPVAALKELTVGLNDRRGSVERAKPRSKVQTAHNTFLGAITVKQFRITSPYGNVTVKLDDINRICPGFFATPTKLGQWTLELRDKSRLKCVRLGGSLRVQTRHGAMAIPFKHIQKATVAADGKSIRVQCHNFDRVAGTLDPKATISLKTEMGQTVLAAKKIALMVHGLPRLYLDIGKGVTLKLVLIPGGKFMMGSPKTETDRRGDEDPQREVTISKPFYMGVYEVTQAQYQAVMGKNPSSFRGANNPVDGVSWIDAVAFCETLSGRTKTTVRLPTEAEWEYACRAGATTRFCFGDSLADLYKYGNYCDRSCTKTPKWGLTAVFQDKEHNDGYDRTSPAGSYRPNAWGLYDMHGNVHEWCHDWFASSYANAGNKDPRGPKSGKLRVQRGGAWRATGHHLRSAIRGRNVTNISYDYGFRVMVEYGKAEQE